MSAARWCGPSRSRTAWARRRRGARPTGPPRRLGSSCTRRRLRSSRPWRRQWSTSLWRATPTSQATVRWAHGAALHGGDGGEEGLGGEVLGERRRCRSGGAGSRRPRAPPGRRGEQGGALVGDRLVLAHDLIIVGRPVLQRPGHTRFVASGVTGTVSVLRGAVAQLVERFHGMEEVRGSIPLSSTTKAQLRGVLGGGRQELGGVRSQGGGCLGTLR